MPKVTLNSIESGFLSVELLNANFQLIQAAFDRTLFLDGAIPNSMSADVDLNGKQLLNAGTAVLDNQIPSFGQLKTAIAAAGSGLVVQRQQQIIATAAQTIVNLTTISYTPGANNLAVFVNGLRRVLGIDYTETNSTRFTMMVGLTVSDRVTAYTNEHLGTVTPASSAVQWSNLLSIPAFATRWPTYGEVTGVPATFAPSAHAHSTADITSGSGLADARRGVWVQAGTPTAGRTGELWLW